jgi:hypothetical protein
VIIASSEGVKQEGRDEFQDGVKPTFYTLLDPKSVKGRFDPFLDPFLTARLIVWPFPEFIPAFLFDPLLMLAAAYRFLI